MTDAPDDHLFRVDKFDVPADARDEFVQQVRRTHSLLEKQPGFVQDRLLERPEGSGEAHFITFVEWENGDAIENSRDAVAVMHESDGFDPQEMFARLDIEVDLGTYTRFDT